MSNLNQVIQATSRTFRSFTAKAGGIRLRPYQHEAAQAILNSIKNRLGLSIVVIFARQSGKDELAANLKAYLLARYVDRDVSIVEVNPTYKPQTINAMNRLEERLAGNLITRIHWRKRNDFMRVFGKAKVSFLSGEGTASVVGATASLLLIVNEAQDIQPTVYDKKFAPMAASTNATRVFMGTTWTSRTLLAREMRIARDAEEKDGLRRVFIYASDDVRRIVPAYGTFVDSEVAKLGREHPLIRTQYFCEEIDSQIGMFNATRLALMAGNPALKHEMPQAAHSYAFLIDVAGQDETKVGLKSAQCENLENLARDSTTLSLINIDLSTLGTLQAPTFHVIARHSWLGDNHLSIFGKIKVLAETWNPQYIVIDATGVGEGLWAMLAKSFPTQVIPIKFSQREKSEIGWRFLAIIETGRFRDSSQSTTVRLQYEACQSEILPGPSKTLRWGVPQGARGPDGELIHDDYVLADALVAALDRLEWYEPVIGTITHELDPLKAMSEIGHHQPLASATATRPNYQDPLEEMSRIR